MGARANNVAYGAADIEVTPNVPESTDRVRVSMMQSGTPVGFLGSLQGGSASFSVLLSDTVQEFDVVAWFDANNNGALDPNEPKTTSLFTIRAVPSIVYQSTAGLARTGALISSIVYPNASALLTAFVTDTIPTGAVAGPFVPLGFNELNHIVPAK